MYLGVTHQGMFNTSGWYSMNAHAILTSQPHTERLGNVVIGDLDVKFFSFIKMRNAKRIMH